MAQKISRARKRVRPVRTALDKPAATAVGDLPAALPGPLAVLFGLSPAGGVPAAAHGRPEHRRKAAPLARKRKVGGSQE